MRKQAKYNKTNISYDTSNPIFYEVVEFNAQFLEQNNFEYANPIILNIFNRNLSSSILDSFKDDEYLGRAVIHLRENQDVLSRTDEIVKP